MTPGLYYGDIEGKYHAGSGEGMIINMLPLYLGIFHGMAGALCTHVVRTTAGLACGRHACSLQSPCRTIVVRGAGFALADKAGKCAGWTERREIQHGRINGIPAGGLHRLVKLPKPQAGSRIEEDDRWKL